MLRADLKSARAAWIQEALPGAERKQREQSQFLAYCNEAGAVLDFPAFRHTFATYLAAGGVNARDLQTVTRHSTTQLALGVYAHTLRGSERLALNALPDLSHATGLQPKASDGHGRAGRLGA
jgi:integrase